MRCLLPQRRHTNAARDTSLPHLPHCLWLRPHLIWGAAIERRYMPMAPHIGRAAKPLT